MSKELLNKTILFKDTFILQGEVIKHLEFKGVITKFDDKVKMYHIKISEWIGYGYPHLSYYLTEEQINKHCTII